MPFMGAGAARETKEGSRGGMEARAEKVFMCLTSEDTGRGRLYFVEKGISSDKKIFLFGLKVQLLSFSKIPNTVLRTARQLQDSREADDEHTASEQDSGDAERNRGSKEEVFTGINARGTIAGSLGRQSTQLEQEEPDEILCVGWKKRNVIAGGRTRETAIDLTDDSFEFCLQAYH
ncbi:hypothetical protein BT96DRAFT_951314 [Gymnopus androsaceus JB14]|uniref:Uncharacterized protein n=1 Tax=Gymnopus androsaceus JB14 TaxID=1447944 RepID=A0A6A4GDI3_9AGAR|nr:hypothetical protein BT96DRAFT_951314 [Gymnopus androsaceus JB14]